MHVTPFENCRVPKLLEMASALAWSDGQGTVIHPTHRSYVPFQAWHMCSHQLLIIFSILDKLSWMEVSLLRH